MTVKRALAPTQAEQSPFERDVFEGLARPEKTVPSQYFYDAVGSDLFEQITVLPEYYPTRTEIQILHACATQIAGQTLPETVLVEFGSGSSVKTDILLAACPAVTRYVPIDVSDASLTMAAQRLAIVFPELRVEPVLGDFTTTVRLPSDVKPLPKLGFFPGSTIGNFGDGAAVSLLVAFRKLLGPGARLIVGADLRKSPDILIPAYNDAAGVTAAFNLNLLARINRELGANFDLTQFAHSATYDSDTGRINMYLVSRIDQTVTIVGTQFHFGSGERIHTEISQKYDIAGLQKLAARGGWMPRSVWTDERKLFSVHEFVAPLET
jgi:dimethylhistidine N-methyltransferase